MRRLNFLRNLQIEQQGFVYTAKTYDLGRPSYLSESISHISSICEFSSRKKLKILEIGAGTF
jgi:protein-L-isoaspartate O-methyltransferase